MTTDKEPGSDLGVDGRPRLDITTEAGQAEAWRIIAAREADKEPVSDALLASVMRKLLAAEYGYSNWGSRSHGRFWFTVDVRQIDITAEEMQAIDDAAPAS